MLLALSSPVNHAARSSVGSQMRRGHNARPSAGDSFEKRSRRGIQMRDATKIEFEFDRVGNQGRRTGMFQAPHVHRPQPPADNHPQNIAVASGAYLGHAPGSWQSPSLLRPCVLLPDSCPHLFSGPRLTHGDSSHLQHIVNRLATRASDTVGAAYVT